MKLYFNGCSHTFGDDLKNPEHDAWPAVLAETLKCEFKNFAISGGSNDRIKYLTIKHIDEFDKFYIAWTYTSRFTRYRSDNNFEINFNPQMKNALYGTDSDFLDYARLHYKIWFNELYAFKLWLQDIILLQNFFESNNKSYVMINADNNLIDRWTIDWPDFKNSVKSMLCFDRMNDQQLFYEHQEIQKLVKQINFKHYIGWNIWWLYKMSSLYPVGCSNHLLEEGHRATAQYILEHDTN